MFSLAGLVIAICLFVVPPVFSEEGGDSELHAECVGSLCVEVSPEEGGDSE